jgi:hypothetical protein
MKKEKGRCKILLERKKPESLISELLRRLSFIEKTGQNIQDQRSQRNFDKMDDYQFLRRISAPSIYNTKSKTNSIALVHKRTIPTKRPPRTVSSADFDGIDCCVVNATNTYGR